MLALLCHVEPMADVLNPRLHFHDLGKLMLAFVMLWAYFSFSQLLIIWAGNLPEEIPFYLQRAAAAAGSTSALMHRARPFHAAVHAAALARSQARRPHLLAKVAIGMLCHAGRRSHLARRSRCSRTQGFPIHWMDIALPVGLAGVWLFLFARQSAAAGRCCRSTIRSSRRRSRMTPTDDPARRTTTPMRRCTTRTLRTSMSDVNIRDRSCHSRLVLLLLVAVSALLMWGMFNVLRIAGRGARPASVTARGAEPDSSHRRRSC